MSGANYSEEEQRNRKIAGLSWQRGTEAMSKQNWDFAVQMFSQCASLVPDNLTYRQTLRGCQEKKYNNNKTGASMAFLKVNAARSKVKKAQKAQQWREMDRAAEEGLALNPWDVQFNSDVGDACRELGYDDVAVFAYQSAVQAQPDNKEQLKKLGEMLEIKGDYQGAISCFEKIFKLDPLNGEARSKVTQLRADSVIDRGGYEKAESTREVTQGYEQSVRGNAANPQEVATPGESPEADLQRMIRKEPQNEAHYLKLGALYSREGRLEDAAKILQQAVDINGNVSIREQLEDVQIAILKRNIDQARTAAGKGDEAAKAKLAKLEIEMRDQQIEIFARRIERYPADMKMKFEQAERLFRAKNFSQATKMLQQAARDPRIEGPVLLMLGKCFLAEKQNVLALRQLEKAVTKFDSGENSKEFCDCHYLMARLYEEAGQKEKAVNSYTEVMAIDYDYRDARARQQKLLEQGG